MIVIKFGGHAMGEHSRKWASEIAARFRSGEKFVIVHGGGPQIDKELARRGIEKKSVNGFRITTPEIMEVVELILAGNVLRAVVRDLISAGIPAVGLTGSDNQLLEVELRDEAKFGLVGQIRKVNPKIINDLLDKGYLPVISPVADDSSSRALNINADIAAGAIAGSLRAEETLFLTDVPGIYTAWPDRSSLITEIRLAELKKISFEGGMTPKVEAVINAIESGASSARVIDGTSMPAFIDALSGDGGTLVKP
ncbi:MAG: acetylglutamate kinase [Actinobacteria bacterium]|nr:acetylglutamate kinase [Actinomycetota bacterium]